MPRYRSVTLAQHELLPGLRVRFAWTLGNQFAMFVSVTEYNIDNSVLNTDHIPREEARARWSALIADGWKLQLTDDR